MKHRSVGFLTTLTLSCIVAVWQLGGTSHAASVVQRPVSGSFLYENAERTYFFAVRNGHSQAGFIASKHASGTESNSQVDSAVGAYAYDCSDLNYRCFKTSRNVLAVPRKRLSINATYEIAGTVFTVIDCLRKVADVCQVALIRSDCQQIKDAETCALYPGGRDKAPNPGPLTYFVYNEDFGVTSLGFPNEKPKDECWIAKLARDYELRGDVGLLKE